jgi:regulator of nucleoside diphosphate kinase
VSVIDVSCASCGAMLDAAESTCRRCGIAVQPTRHPLFGVVARTAHQEACNGEVDIVVTARDFMLLEELARLRLDRGSPAARGLLQTLERCRVVPPDRVAADVVTLDSRVVFSADGRAEEQRVLVHPDGHTLPGWSLPVTVPRGLAMLGRRTGSTVMAERPGWGTERIDILFVAYQPEEEMRRRRAAAAGGAALASPVFLRRPAGLADTGGPPHDGDDGDLPPAA